MEVEVNKHGLNKKIHATILPDELMIKAGFRKHEDGAWSFFRVADQEHDIGFYVTIRGNDQEDLDIVTIDEDFGQPYDYQSLLERRPNDPFLKRIQATVEKYMKQLELAGIISGHVRGEYI